jgi:hypothetical protein
MLARAGYAVFPCTLTADGRKVPTCPHGIDDARKDPAEVERLFRHYPGTLIGVRCGAISNLAVLDIDRHLSAKIWWAETRSRFPVTRAHRTARSGMHLLFQYRTDFPTTVGRIVKGVDTRAEGGFVVWWPAANFPVLCERPIAAAPDFLIEALKPKAPVFPVSREHRVVPDNRRIRGILDKLESAPEGERNNMAFWAALCLSEMIGPCLSYDEALDLIVASACRTGLSVREATATAKSGLRGHR